MTNPEIYKTANAIGPAIGDIISDGVETFQGIFGIRDGEPSGLYTREGTATAKDLSGNSITVQQDNPQYRFINGEKVYQQSEPPAATVNAGTTSLLAEDIDTASYCFDSTQSDQVEILNSSSLNYADGDTVEFEAYIKFADYATGTRQRLYSKNKQYSFRISGTGYLEFAIPVVAAATADTTLLVDGTAYKICISYNTVTDTVTYKINDVVSSSTSFSSLPIVDTDNVFVGSSGTSEYSDGCMYSPVFRKNSVAVFSATFSEYREDTFVEDSSGNSNNGTVSRSVDNLISENDAFGYPVNKKALKPWKSSIGTPYGLKDLFGGVDGNNAVGNGKMFKHTIYDLSANVVLWEGQNGTDILYFDSADNLIKLTDGTNTAVSDSVVVASTEFTVIPEWNDTEMWIIKDGSQGTKVTFAGTFPALGNRLLIIPDGVYQTNRDVLFNDRLIGS